VAGFAAGLLALCGPAFPQSQLPSDPSASTIPISTWRLETTVFGGWESNALRDQPDGASDYLYGIRAVLAHEQRSPRGQVSLSLDGSGRWYREVEGRDRWEGSGNLAVSRLLSERTTLGLSGGYSRRFSDGLQVLNDLGLQVALTRSEALDAGGRLDVRLTQRMRWSADVRYDRVDFDSNDLVNTDSLRAGSSLARRIGRRDDLSISYSYRRTSREPVFDAHSSSLGWGHTFSARLSMSIDAGASYVPFRSVSAEGSGDGVWSSYGGISLTGTGRRSSLSFSYRKGITPGFGLGRNLDSDIVNVALSAALGRNGNLTVSGTRAWSRQVFASSERFRGDYADVRLSRRLGRHFGLSLRYGYRRREIQEGVPVESHSAGLAVTYTIGPP